MYTILMIKEELGIWEGVEGAKEKLEGWKQCKYSTMYEILKKLLKEKETRIL